MPITPELPVNRLGFGTLHLTEQRGFGPARKNAVELLRYARKSEVNFIDTADSYGPEHAENIVREALHPYEDVIVATKGGFEHKTVDEWVPNGDPDHLQDAVEASLKRLGVEQIDIYQLHTPDPNVPYRESLEAIREIQQEGKVRLTGVSNVSLDELKLAAEVFGDTLVCVQNYYNVLYHQGFGNNTPPDCDNEAILDFCDRTGLAFIAWAPLGDGALNDKRVDRTEIDAAAKEYKTTAEAVMLAALLQRSPSIIVIPGTSSVAHLKYNIAALRLELTPEELERIWIRRRI